MRIKTIFGLLVIAVALSAGFISCGDDKSGEGTWPPPNPILSSLTGKWEATVNNVTFDVKRVFLDLYQRDDNEIDGQVKVYGSSYLLFSSSCFGTYRDKYDIEILFTGRFTEIVEDTSGNVTERVVKYSFTMTGHPTSPVDFAGDIRIQRETDENLETETGRFSATATN